MKFLIIVGTFGFLLSCSTPKTDSLKGDSRILELATASGMSFQDNVHSLCLYAFQRVPSGLYVYHSTLANLDNLAIAALPDNASGNASKLLRFTLPIGNYQLFALGNVPGNKEQSWVIGQTTPDEALVHYDFLFQDSIYFRGTTSFIAEATSTTSLQITLNRMMCKMVYLLYGVPVEIDSVALVLSNLASEMTLAGSPSGKARMIRKSSLVRKIPGYVKDTIVEELIASPSLLGGSPMQLIFYARNGQVKTKEMPVQALLPDKYIRIVAQVDDDLGALLSFDIKVSLLLIDYWQEQTMPDFILSNP